MKITFDRSKEPDVALPVDAEFATLYADVTCEGALIAARTSVAIVGLARDIEPFLRRNIPRIYETARHFDEWKCFVVENDSTDGTKELLTKWGTDDPEHVIVEMTNNGKPRLTGFEPERTRAMAAYRNRCRELVQEHMPNADYVLILDLDAWGGWSIHGVINSLGWHERLPMAGAMASTSLFKHQHITVEGVREWLHYDNWAYRWIGWANRMGPWFTFWMPPPGSPPIEVNSAFGGCCTYKGQAFLECEYSSPDGDCEHVHFHRMMNEKGWTVFLNPAQRCVMTWLADEENTTDGGHHSDDQR